MTRLKSVAARGSFKYDRRVLPFRLDLPPPPGKNSRRQPRRKASGLTLTCTRVAITRLAAARNRTLAAQVYDVGRGGVRFTSTEPLEDPGPVDVQIREEATGQVLHARGEVAWIKTHREGDRDLHVVGVKFQEILAPAETCARILDGTSQAPAAPAKRRSMDRFSLSDCDVTLERDHRFRTHEPPGNLAVRILDISRSGAQVLCSQRLQRGDRVRLTLNLRSFQDIFTAEAEAVWVRTPGLDSMGQWKVGVSFGALSHEQERKLKAFEAWFARPKS